MRRYGLRKGDAVEGSCERPRVLDSVDRVNGLAPPSLSGRAHFRDLTPVHPTERLRLETEKGGPALRIVDLVSPSARASAACSSHRRRPERRSCSSSSPPPSPPTTPSAT